MSTQKLIARRAAASEADSMVIATAAADEPSEEAQDGPTAVETSEDPNTQEVPSVLDNISSSSESLMNSGQSDRTMLKETGPKNLIGHHEHGATREQATCTENEILSSIDNSNLVEFTETALESSKTVADKITLGNATTESKPSTRSRTRSLSSALSSQSGGDSLPGDDSADAIFFDDDGKTPLRTNRMSSRGPVRKRHKNEGPRALFRTDSSGQKSSQTNKIVAVDFKEDTLPPFENDSTSSSVSATLRSTRERSNTIESFRAAMNSQLNNELPTESIVLPDMNKSKISVVDGKLGETDNHNLLLSGRDRSDTIDFLTSAVEFQLDGDTSNNLDEIFLSPIDSIKEQTIDRQATKVVKNVTANYQAQDVPKGAYLEGMSNDTKALGGTGDAYGKTPKINNRLRTTSQSSESTSQGPLRKRYRTRSLSFALLQEEDESLDKNEHGDGSENMFPSAEGMDDDEIMAESGSGYDSFEIFGRRSRSDTLDFLTAAVAGDLGHDLDAAAAAVANDGAAFTMHHVSAPSGASTKYNPLLPKRPRSDTLDSTASSINSAKLDFFVSVAAEHGLLLSPVHNGGKLCREGAESTTSDHSSEYSQRRPRSNTLEIFSNMASARARSNTVEFMMGSNEPLEGSIDDLGILPDSIEEYTATSNVLDHLRALCDDPKGSEAKSTKILRFKRHPSSDVMDGIGSPKTKSDEGSFTGKKLRRSPESSRRMSISQDSFSNNSSRNRLESWGGMSDLSTGVMGSSAIAATHTALKDTGILDDVFAAAADLGFDDLSEGVASFERMRENRSASIGSNSLSIQKGRQRLDSLASLSLASLSDTSSAKPYHKSTSDSKTDTKASVKDPKVSKPSDVSSVGAASIVVDYDAIASAVHAANAATDGLDLSTILSKPSSSSLPNINVDVTPKLIKGGKKKDNTLRPSKISTSLPKAPATLKETSISAKNIPRPYHKSQVKPVLPSTKAPPQILAATPEPAISGSLLGLNNKPPITFPVSSINIPLVPIPTCTKTKEEMDARQERARAAAGYVPPGVEGSIPVKITSAQPMQDTSSNTLPPQPDGITRIPIKKRTPHPPCIPIPDHVRSQDFKAPHSNVIPLPVPSSAPTSKAGTLQSQQKWDDMFECLVKFIEETREKSTKNMTEEQKAAWIWDGNVQTSYKTPCGKALGRWINNQRSAKAKGALKDDREVRLVSTGLKWSVLTTNSWRQMLRELEIYVLEQTKDGGTWDGNVPTNYKIKSNIPTYNTDDEEKNLGRWVNRQRSLFQAGKLKKDRQQDLEKIGLKWSVLLTTSWTTMYESLCAYAEEKRKQSPHGWDGNVPANFKTRSNPSLSLGRWVNRQRSAHAKGRLKDEYVKQLDAVGLRWVIHARNKTNDEGDGADEEDDEDDDDDFVGGEFTESVAGDTGTSTAQGTLVSGNDSNNAPNA